MSRYPAVVPPTPQVRRFGAINWVGLWTLYHKEVRRFVKVATQTLLAPLVTTLLYLAIFVLAIGDPSHKIGDVPFRSFLAPGLIMMAMVQNAFANTSSSIMIAKIQGNIVDTLMPPLSPGELTCGFALGGMTRGLAVGLVMWGALAILLPVGVHNLLFILFYAVAASLMLSLLGIVGGIWAEKFDHLAAVTNFIITPFAFLSGTFYSISGLPTFWYGVAHLNPFFYMIDGFRYGFTGHADGSLTAGLTVLAVVNVLLWTLVHRMFARGYRLKA
jgi:ABC-2 type transport system permease protein